MTPVEAAHRAAIRAHAEKHRKAGRATFSIAAITELLDQLEAAEAERAYAMTEARRSVDTLAALTVARAEVERLTAALAAARRADLRTAR
jgi:hypothetical protein